MELPKKENLPETIRTYCSRYEFHKNQGLTVLCDIERRTQILPEELKNQTCLYQKISHNGNIAKKRIILNKYFFSNYPKKPIFLLVVARYFSI